MFNSESFRNWLLKDKKEIHSSRHPSHAHSQHEQHAWWKVMCLTGVDYFSTLGYQPGIAFLAAGALSPFATLVLVLLTLFGALPMYKRVAEESPYGDGSISMLEHLLSRWKGKMFVLALLGFAATSFIITITLSAADATAHIVENPFVVDHMQFLNHKVIVTLILVGLLGAVFLKGFSEAINLAVGIVGIYMFANIAVIMFGLYQIVFVQPVVISNWTAAVWSYPNVEGSILAVVIYSVLVFPKLALGLSGFETGVLVMPQIRSDVEEEPAEAEESIHESYLPEVRQSQPEKMIAGRIRNAKKLLSGAAFIMSLMLVGSSIVTTLLIPAKAFEEGGEANGRALSYLAHQFFGDFLGTIYDLSTIMILWFAGASAMAGLLNVVPRYLPRYGMAPDWALATRPLALVFTAVAFVVTIIFQADVDAQGGAYATGVLFLMASAAVAVTISAYKGKERTWIVFLIITAVFAYTTVVNIVDQPEGLKIAILFILGIVLTSFISRAIRSTELRIDKIELDETAARFIDQLADGPIRIVANRREAGDLEEYRFKEKEKRLDNHIPAEDPILFYEIDCGDASEFKGTLKIGGTSVGRYKILRAEAPAVPNAIAALLLNLRDRTGKIPHMYFGWSEGNPIQYLIRFLLFGEGDTAPVTREILRQAEPDPAQRPNVHVGG
ncbi:MAG: hypothetical protein R2684_16680 [Pyrinomonadaceae bacterium]